MSCKSFWKYPCKRFWNYLQENVVWHSSFTYFSIKRFKVVKILEYHCYKLGLKWRRWEVWCLRFLIVSLLVPSTFWSLEKLNGNPSPLDYVSNCPDVYPGCNIFSNLSLCQENTPYLSCSGILLFLGWARPKVVHRQRL